MLSPEARAIRVDSAFHMLLKRYPSSTELADWVNRLPGSGATAGIFGTAMVEDIAATAEYFARSRQLSDALYVATLFRSAQSSARSSGGHERRATDPIERRGRGGGAPGAGPVRCSRVRSSEPMRSHRFSPTTCTAPAGTSSSESARAPFGHRPRSSSRTRSPHWRARLTEADIIAGVFGTNKYYEKHGSTQAGLIEGVYQDLLGRAPTNAEVTAALNKYTNNSVGHTAFAQSMVASPEYQNQVVSLDYQQLLLRAPFTSEADAGSGRARRKAVTADTGGNARRRASRQPLNTSGTPEVRTSTSSPAPSTRC